MALTSEEIKKIYDEPDKKTNTKPMGFFEKIWLVLRHPNQFSQRITAEKGLKAPFLFYLLFFVISIITSFISMVSLTSNPIFSLMESSYGGMLVSFTIVILIIVSALVLALLFVVVFFVQIVIKHVFHGKGTYADTYRAVVYSSTPQLVLSPIIGIIVGSIQSLSLLVMPYYLFLTILFSIWSLVLYIKIGASLHKISGWAVFAASLLAGFLFMIVIVIVISVIGFIFVFGASMLM